MNIKSLLLGSAAALVAVSGARAADAVVIAEPEPMEYVRVCDTYGVGFYYIPGTETCLKLSGYIRYDIGVGARGFEDVWDKEDLLNEVESTNDTYFKRARFAFRADARAETELGTVRGYAQINFQYDVNTYDGFTYAENEGAIVNHAYLELGGFRVGKTDSLFSTFTGYAGNVLLDDAVAFGPYDTHQIAYTFTGGNGFTAAVALEEGGEEYAIDSYVPHVAGGVGWTGGWGGVSVVAGYDSIFDEGAIKGRVDFNATDAISLFVMGAWATNDDSTLADSGNYYAPWGGEWAVWGGASWKFTEKAAFNVQAGYDDFENLSVVANVDYELVPNLVITPEVSYYDAGDEVSDEDGEWGGFLRVQYNWGG